MLQEQDEVARVLGLADADVLLCHLAWAGRTIAYSLDQSLRQAQRSRGTGGRGTAAMLDGAARGGRLRGRRAAGGPSRLPLADGLVEQDGEVVLARSADPAADPALAAARRGRRRRGRPAAGAAHARAAGRSARRCPCPGPPRPATPWSCCSGTGQATIAAWEALDQEGLLAGLLPDWDRVRNRPQRNPLRTYTVDRHLVETAAGPPRCPVTWRGRTCCCCRAAARHRQGLAR